MFQLRDEMFYIDVSAQCKVQLSASEVAFS